MLWALISPFRHTSQPPKLALDSPLRIFFERHGSRVARHPVLSIVLSVALSVVLSYPFLFVYRNSETSDTRHVWTSARPLSGSSFAPDIGIKQAWVQGSWMNALTSEVLAEGLSIQEALLGPDASCTKSEETDVGYYAEEKNCLRDPGVFFHSPLLYWNCSLSAVQQDPNILATVNGNYMRRSPANVTLRWGSVFAGKQFAGNGNRLMAADSLVISLFYNTNSNVGAEWDERAALLAKKTDSSRYTVFPPHGRQTKSTFYEFRFEPMSTLDIIILSACYLSASLYLIVSLRRLKAVKSRFGLVVTVLTQVCTSIAASFTMLTLLRVPMTHLPREYYPFAVLVIGIENMFRLSNAVLSTPPEQPTSVRISSALGEVGFLSMTAVATDLAILFLIGSLSVPAVKEFCIFSGVALAIDFVLHLTYFLAVLSVDVRRLELQDSLDRMNMNVHDDINLDMDGHGQKANAVIEFLFHGGAPLSTRIAGSVILICFAILLNIHFFDNRSPLDSARILLDAMHTTQSEPFPKRSAIEPSTAITVARSHMSWLKLQDHLTSMELIRAVKPGATRLVAQAYDPLFFVLSGANRAKPPASQPTMFAVMDFSAMRNHFQPFLLTFLFLAAGVTILMNYLLMNHALEDAPETTNKHEGPQLTVQTLYEGHSLDVAMLAASPRGVVVSVGLDRRIVVWKLKGNRGRPVKDLVRPTCSEHLLWPVMAIALDPKGEWLAIAPRSGVISFYRVHEGTFDCSIAVELKGQTPSAFFFAPAPRGDEQSGPRLIILRKDGVLFELCGKTKEAVRHRICEGVVVSSSQGIITPRLPIKVVTACQQGRIFVTAKRVGVWYTEQLNLMAPPITSPLTEVGEPCTILPLSALGMVVSSRSCNVELVDILSGCVIRTFQTGHFKPSTLRAFHAKRRTCLYCGCPTVLSFSIAYSDQESGMFMLHTFTSSRGRMRDICLRAERDRRERKCLGFESVDESQHWLDNVEGWEPTNLNLVAGIRRREAAVEESSADDYEWSTSAGQKEGGIRRRRREWSAPRSNQDEDEDMWESFTMDANGIVNTYPLNSTELGEDGLLVSRAGPVTKVGQRSVAAGFGNTVKLLLVGNEQYEAEEPYDPTAGISRRPKRNMMR